MDSLLAGVHVQQLDLEARPHVRALSKKPHGPIGAQMLSRVPSGSTLGLQLRLTMVGDLFRARLVGDQQRVRRVDDDRGSRRRWWRPAPLARCGRSSSACRSSTAVAVARSCRCASCGARCPTATTTSRRRSSRRRSAAWRRRSSSPSQRNRSRSLGDWRRTPATSPGGGSRDRRRRALASAGAGGFEHGRRAGPVPRGTCGVQHENAAVPEVVACSRR